MDGDTPTKRRHTGYEIGGYTMWARQTIDSEIFYDKPHVWFKIWFFLVNRVNYQPVRKWGRGECFTTHEEIARATKATKGQVKHCIDWLKKEQMLDTHKATRGFHITVIKYDLYQTNRSYTTDEPTYRRHTGDTLKEKKDKKEKNTTCKQELWISHWNKFSDPSILKKHGSNPTTKKQLLPECKKVTPDLIKAVQKLEKDGYALADFEHAVQRYIVEIVNRKGRGNGDSYLGHRFYLIKFLKQENGFRQFVSM